MAILAAIVVAAPVFGVLCADSEAPLVVAGQLKEPLLDDGICLLGEVPNRPEAFSAKLIIHRRKLG
ncbi:hypothetical protein AC629_11015 [Bradyrhizobium sp. NAS80.1]|uniref:hypothetical protein n=1 Tax=Bradyrhizobium sp. NAS80.1 TaxID=1680159 RepID=UPI000961694E|nr:hypothetical protein [Bradyrhizobium sp. NAS80.1]OKO88069.1 hypothetical protein AC629_11015 [Bradyrhizobium sp. NAS80.1]